MTEQPEAKIGRNKQVALEFLRFAYADDVPAALQLLTDDATWWVAGPPGRLPVSGHKKREKIGRLLGSVRQAVPGGMTYIVHGVTAEADRVAVEIESDGVWLNGRRYQNRYHFLFTLRDGLIVGVREYMDTLHLHDVMQP